MARIWSQPECGSGTCIIYEHNLRYDCVQGARVLTGDANLCFCQQTNSDSACAQALAARIAQYTYNFPIGMCGGGAQSITTGTYVFQPGQTCCNPTIFPNCYVGGCYSNEVGGYGVCTRLNDCCASLSQNCNPGFCLPASGGDPPGCFNITNQCAGAMGGTSVPTVPGDPERPPYCKGESDERCGGTGCCLCDRCCDMDSTTCLAKGGTVMSGSCSAPATQTSCKNNNVKPSCKQGIWKLGIRPDAHYANMTNPVSPHRLDIASVAKQKTKDNPGGIEECKINYGWLQRSATGNAMEGRICNTYNRNRTNCGNATLNANKSPTLNLVRSATTGAMEFVGRYRVPCPEQSEFLSTCNTQVGCAA